jgi:manganese transport protein
MSATTPPLESPAWRYPRTQPSLPESYHSVNIPKGVSFWRKALAFAGPGYMVAVGYMDPGNWATDFALGIRSSASSCSQTSWQFCCRLWL